MSLNTIFHSIFSALFIASVIRISTPIIFSALGGLISIVAGTPNLALEGIMNIGAFIGVIVSAYTGNIFLAVLAGIVAGILAALIVGTLHLYLQTDLFITGLAMNFFATGLTVFLLFLLTGDKGSTTTLKSLSVPIVYIPLINEMPFIGKILSGNSLFTYLAFILVFLVYIFFYRTRFGIHLRAVGENPEAASSLGISVTRTRLIAYIISGAFAAMGGMSLSMAYLQMFVRDMAGGRGWIGIAAAFLGSLKPGRTLFAALIFGFADAISNQLGSLKIPPPLVQMIPYLVTVFALAIFTIREKYTEVERKKKCQRQQIQSTLSRN